MEKCFRMFLDGRNVKFKQADGHTFLYYVTSTERTDDICLNEMG